MATLSEDSDSWKASGIRRRDFRSSKEEPETNRHMGDQKKNTKKWCKGKVGREHDIVHQVRQRSYGTLHVDVCQRCQKEFKTYWPGWRRNSTNCAKCGKQIGY